MRLTRQLTSPPLRKGGSGGVALLVFDGSVASSLAPPCPASLRRDVADLSAPNDGERSSLASQSRSSGCDGVLPITPKSFSEFTSPSPKCPCQRRFTMTRGTSGFLGPVIQRASERRRRVVAASGPAVKTGVEQAERTPGNPG